MSGLSFSRSIGGWEAEDTVQDSPSEKLWCMLQAVLHGVMEEDDVRSLYLWLERLAKNPHTEDEAKSIVAGEHTSHNYTIYMTCADSNILDQSMVGDNLEEHAHACAGTLPPVQRAVLNLLPSLAPTEVPQLWPDLIQLHLNLLQPQHLPSQASLAAGPAETDAHANVNRHALTALSMEKTVEMLAALYR